ncbi:hypothetical protein TNCV_4403441 [Trichonephila clavipes]|uniref:Uncharacterized protein n=1 Tax=Trichonephila clavipes TaxID=2585209 RepID=A0A8X6V5K6_TRICX|nr:hypothetical protein TNCV_4403441 [Trichonephila clavipes]
MRRRVTLRKPPECLIRPRKCYAATDHSHSPMGSHYPHFSAANRKTRSPLNSTLQKYVKIQVSKPCPLVLHHPSDSNVSHLKHDNQTISHVTK